MDVTSYLLGKQAGGGASGGTEVFILKYTDSTDDLKTVCSEIYTKMGNGEKPVIYLKTENNTIFPAEYVYYNGGLEIYALFDYNAQSSGITFIKYKIMYFASSNSCNKMSNTYTVPTTS